MVRKIANRWRDYKRSETERRRENFLGSGSAEQVKQLRKASPFCRNTRLLNCPSEGQECGDSLSVVNTSLSQLTEMKAHSFNGVL